MKPIILRTVGKDKFEILFDYNWEDVSIPAGFITDLDSVPRIPFVYALIKGRARISAIIHDYLCVYSNLTQKEIDKVFKKAMKAEGVDWLYKNLIYYSTRLYQTTIGKVKKKWRK